MNSKFGEAPVMREGGWVKFDSAQPDPTPQKIAAYDARDKGEDTTWIEFPVKVKHEKECWEMINVWLKANGYEGYEDDDC